MNDRYFKKEWEESYYIFDSETITEKEVDEAIEYDNKVFSLSMQGDEIVDRLNTYSQHLIQAGKQIEKGVEIAKEKQVMKQEFAKTVRIYENWNAELKQKLTLIEREFRERGILTEKEFLELIK